MIESIVRSTGIKNEFWLWIDVGNLRVNLFFGYPFVTMRHSTLRVVNVHQSSSSKWPTLSVQMNLGKSTFMVFH